MSKTRSTTELKPFDSKEFKEKVGQGIVIGTASTTMTFTFMDKPLAHATKAAADGNFVRQSTGWFVRQILCGNYAATWNNSLYGQAYQATLQHPIKGFPVALLNSWSKNAVLFPVKYASENVYYSFSSDDKYAQLITGFSAGALTVYLTAPIAVVKARMMTNVPLNTLNMRRLMSGASAIALRDGVQYGSFFYSLDVLKAQFGDNLLTAGVAGFVGYCFSNPFNATGLVQRTSQDSLTIPKAAKKIYQTSGIKGFYPLMLLSTVGMFARGIAIKTGSDVYKSVMNDKNVSSSTQMCPRPKNS